jgi:hypothetical protein
MANNCAIKMARIFAQTNISKIAKAKDQHVEPGILLHVFLPNQGCATYYFLLRSMGIGPQTSNSKMRSARVFVNIRLFHKIHRCPRSLPSLTPENSLSPKSPFSNREILSAAIFHGHF